MDVLKWNAHGDTVIVEMLDKQEEKTSSGLVLLATGDTNLPIGKVVAVGAGAWSQTLNHVRIPIDIEVGDLVVINNQPSPMNPVKEFKPNGVTHYMIRASSVLMYQRPENAKK